MKPVNQKDVNVRTHRCDFICTKYAQSLRPNETRNFVGLAWLGLWGKTPEKQMTNAEPSAEQGGFLDPPTEPPSPNTVPPADQWADLSPGYIPEPPPILDENIIMNVLGEPSFHSLGLGSHFTPAGWVQMAFEFLHADLGLSWLQAIVVFTVVLRICLFPITIKAQKNGVKMRRMGPSMARLNEKLNDAKESGNVMAGNRKRYIASLHYVTI